jgi:hypothetical protein
MKYILSSILLFLSLSSQATFINNGNYTTDEATGLNWLDLNLSSNSTLEQALAANIGYQAASLAQVQTLFTNVFSSLDGTLYNNVYFDNPSAGYTESLSYMSLFSITSLPNASYALVGGSLELFGVATEFAQIQVTTNSLIGLQDQANPNVGWCLVEKVPTPRAPDQRVPEPATIVIFASGVLGLAIVRRRNRIDSSFNS